MPLYDYKCKDCKIKFEKKLNLADFEKNKSGKLQVDCPECKSKNTYNMVTGGHAQITGIFSK